LCVLENLGTAYSVVLARKENRYSFVCLLFPLTRAAAKYQLYINCLTKSTKHGIIFIIE